MAGVIQTPELSRRRIWMAYAIAVLTDAAQMVLGPAGWVGTDQGADIVAMILLTAVLGFHPLFLPTFILEMLPIADMLPTWTGCVMLVVALRRRSAAVKPDAPAPRPQPPVIDI